MRVIVKKKLDIDSLTALLPRCYGYSKPKPIGERAPLWRHKEQISVDKKYNTTAWDLLIIML